MRWALTALAAADEGVCLLQTEHFLQKYAGEAALGNGLEAATPCPGDPIVAAAELGLCTYSGVQINWGGESITELFDDNVEMRDFYYQLGAAPRQKWEQIHTHPFPVGTTVVTVHGHDLADNSRACTREVTVHDGQKPKWVTDPASVDGVLTLHLDGNCTVMAWDAFERYEAMGWEAAATDNCGVESVVKQVRQGGAVLFDSRAVATALPSDLRAFGPLRGPGEFELLYTATDVHGAFVTHSVVLKLVDVEPPTETGGCPDDITVEIEAHETEATVHWTLPYVSADNCLGLGALPAPDEAHGYRPGQAFPPGSHPVAYPLRDAAGNLAAAECTFVVTVKQKAHPVVIACPNDVTVQTLQSSMFGVPTWPPPSATQGGEPLGEEHISYPQGVRSGLPFPYGTTTVTAEARGRVTGERTGEAEQFDFCTFRVTVRDPFRPHVDGRHFRCAEPAGDAGAVEPYGICAGTDLRPAFHDGYEVTGGYDVLGVEKLEALPCCADQHGTAYTCAGGEFPGFTYCVPQAALAQKPVLALDVARSVADSGQADAWVLAGQRVCLPAESMKAIAVAARGGLAACQAAARADPDCTDAVVYGGPQRCLCSRTACDETQEQPDVDLYRLPKGLTLPQRQRSRWAFRGNAHCAPLGKELGKPAGSLEACKAAALADADCTGVIAYSRTNLMQCLCSTDACAAPKPHPDYEMYQRVGEP